MYILDQLLADSSSVPHFHPESSKCRVGFGESVIDFHVDVGFSRESASQVGERVSSFQSLVIHKDVWLVIHLSLCRLVQDFCILGADGKTKVVASSRKVIHALLPFHFSVAVKSAVIRNEEFSQCGYLHIFFALSRLRLNTPPSVLYFSWMPSSIYCEARDQCSKFSWTAELFHYQP